MTASKVAFHAAVALMTMGIFSIAPGSVCVAVPLLGLIAAFAGGRRSAEGEETAGAERPLPWFLLVHALAMFMGSMVSLGWLIFAVKKG
jgi:hypothetical protein